MPKSSQILLPLALLFAALLMLSAPEIQAAPPPGEQQQAAGHTPADLISAVNQLRKANGLNALSPHPALMEVAQWEADAIAGGAPGHTRPPGLTLGAWMISLGYPLGGNIALDGYRSENWIGGSELTVDEAIELWLGDAPHTNTMLSSQRSDIGAGVALGKDPWGKTVYYYVIETALQTSSGQQQPEALALLTSLPETMQALYPDGTQAAAAAAIPQYMIPVSRATARPDGDVVHEVRYGQSLWSIAIEYGVKIDQIKLLNNLASNQVWTGQHLLVQKKATQPALPPSATAPQAPRNTPRPPTQAETLVPTATVEFAQSESPSGFNPTLMLFLIVVILVLGMVAWLILHDLRG